MSFKALRRRCTSSFFGADVAIAAFGGELMVLEVGFEVLESSFLPLFTPSRLAASEHVNNCAMSSL
jgi:hypothetical protein